ncbi:MAG: protein kinase [Anaerolineae bacterium]|nr:protein kinase [Anaerolineae bacterium]
MIGRNLGNYRLIEQIGIGGMATVYKAYDPDTDRYVAVKILPEHFSQDPKFRQRFEREAKAIAKLEHIHILPLFTYGEDNGIAYMVMRYLEAGSLTDRMKKGALSLTEASRLLSQIAAALDYAHAHGVLHRDVKPSNVLLDSSGNAFLMDFGIAKMVASTLDLTGGGILGTPAYMSPEQCRGNTELTPASDQYSLGIILYEMVTGRPPFQAETPIALIHMQLNDPLPLPRQVRPELSEEIERVVLKALTKDPNLRFRTCGDMVAAFARAVAKISPEQTQPAEDSLTIASEIPAAVTTPDIEDATVLHGTAVPGQAARPRRRFPVWAFGLAGVLVIGLLAVAVAVVVGLIPSGQAEETQPSVTVVELPEGTRRVKPCVWDDHGPGLCIYDPPREQPDQKILPETDFEITGGVSWSPDGKKIAFSAIELGGNPSQDHALYLVNADGTDLAKLPPINNDIGPAWSPDGEWLAFHSGCDLAIMHPDGSEPKIIWNSDGQQSACVEQPQWSPDSRSIVVSGMVGGGGEPTFPATREVWIVSDEGHTFTSIATIVYENDECLMPDVAFSPDNTHVTYLDEKCRAWLVNADGSGQPELLDEFPYWWTAAVDPQWGQAKPVPEIEPESATPLEPTPDFADTLTDKIIEHCENSEPPQLCLRNAVTNRVAPITQNLTFETIILFAWSPDGEQIVFDAGTDPATDIYDHKLYLIKADGSNLKQLTSGNTNDVFPDWSPDNQLIAFARDCSLWVIRPDGTGAKQLLPGDDRFCVSIPAWSPDSRQIAFLNSPDDETIPYEILILDPNQPAPKVVHSFDRPVEPFLITWNPDGQQLAIWFAGDAQPRIVLVNINGSGEPKLIEGEMLEILNPWTWIPSYWPRWAGKQTVVRPPVQESKETLIPSDPWGDIVIPPGGTINLAFVGALSGELSELGAVQKNAFLMALEEKSAIKGFPIKAGLIVDGGCGDPDLGQKAAQDVVVEANIVGLVGHTCSASCMGGAPVYEDAHLVWISPSCSNPNLTEQGFDVFNRLVFRDDRDGDEKNAQVVDTPIYQEFAQSYQDAYGQSLAEIGSGFFAAYTYDATNILLQAIEVVSVEDEAGNLIIGRHILAEAVRNIPAYPGVTGVIRFDDQGDRLLP